MTSQHEEAAERDEPELEAEEVNDLEPTEDESERVLGGPAASGNIGCKEFKGS